MLSGLTAKCLDDSGGGTANGNKIDIWSCDGAAAQSWTMAADGTVQVFGKCLDIVGAGTANNTKVDLYQCVFGAANQQWQALTNGQLFNPHSGRCLDDPGSSTTNGTQLDIYDCVSGAANEMWSPPTAPPADPVTGPVTSGLAGKCLDDYQSGTANGNKIDIYSCNGTAAQSWTAAADGTVQVFGKCLDIVGDGTANNTKIDLYQCVSGAANQQWQFRGN
ncbi:MAG TPA: ricin-type beta-trefoil lectin domain protein, partial [Streptosporangiaceae bacterium]|nr:ricin-type beta-trefoil lectin domain protein [Streptosporangiaceae bacterium]